MALNPQQQRRAWVAVVPALAFFIWLFLMSVSTLLRGAGEDDRTGIILGVIGVPLSTYLVYRAGAALFALLPTEPKTGPQEGAGPVPTRPGTLQLVTTVWAGRPPDEANRAELAAQAAELRRRTWWLLPALVLSGLYWAWQLWSALAAGHRVGLTAGASTVFLVLLAAYNVAFRLRLHRWCRRYL